jgi:hypothetical protein
MVGLNRRRIISFSHRPLNNGIIQRPGFNIGYAIINVRAITTATLVSPTATVLPECAGSHSALVVRYRVTDSAPETEMCSRVSC